MLEQGQFQDIDSKEILETEKFSALLRTGKIEDAKKIFDEIVSNQPELQTEMVLQAYRVAIDYLGKELLGYADQILAEFSLEPNEELANGAKKVLIEKINDGTFTASSESYEEFRKLLNRFGVEKKDPEIQAAVCKLIVSALEKSDFSLVLTIINNHDVKVNDENRAYFEPAARQAIVDFLSSRDKKYPHEIEYASIVHNTLLVPKNEQISMHVNEEAARQLEYVRQNKKRDGYEYRNQIRATSDSFPYLAQISLIEIDEKNNSELNSLVVHSLKEGDIGISINIVKSLQNYRPSEEVRNLLIQYCQERAQESGFLMTLGIITKAFRLSDSPEFNSLLKNFVIDELKKGNFSHNNLEYRLSDFEGKMLDADPDFIQKAQAGLVEAYKQGFSSLVVELVNRFKIPLTEETKTAIAQIISQKIITATEDTHYGKELETLGLKDHSVVQEVFTQKIESFIANKDFFKMASFIKEYQIHNIPDETRQHLMVLTNETYKSMPGGFLMGSILSFLRDYPHIFPESDYVKIALAIIKKQLGYPNPKDGLVFLENIENIIDEKTITEEISTLMSECVKKYYLPNLILLKKYADEKNLVLEDYSSELVYHLPEALASTSFELEKYEEVISLFGLEAEKSQIMYRGVLLALANDRGAFAKEIMDQYQIPLNEEIKTAARACILRALADNRGTFAKEIMDQYQIPLNEEIKTAARACILREVELNNFDQAKLVNEMFELKDKNLARTLELFGEFASKESYLIVARIDSGDMSDADIVAAGITEEDSNPRRFEKIKRYMEKMKRRFISPDFRVEELMSSDLLQDYFRAYTRTKKSIWGSINTSSAFREALISFQEQSLDTRPLSPEYQPSQVLRINRIDREKIEARPIAPHVKEKYELYAASLLAALEKVKNMSMLQAVREYISKANELASEIVSQLEEKLQKIRENEKIPEKNRLDQIAKIEQDIEQIKNLNFRDLDNFEANFAFLGKYKEFHELMREIVFFAALRKNPAWQERSERLLKEEVNIENLEIMDDFVSHITVQETWNDYFSNPQARKIFEEITNLKAFKEEFDKNASADIAGTIPLMMVPDRNLIMQFSGNIADACWAGKYRNLPKEKPNFVALAFVQNPDTPNERLAGATMLIEAVSQENEPLLIIRGLNPIENVANQLQIQDFFNQLIAYLRPIAESQGRKLAIVIDDHSGGSGTNRGVVHNFLFNQLKNSLEPVALKSNEETNFNGYNITNKTYLIG